MDVNAVVKQRKSDDVTEVIDKAKELFGQCERNMINNHIKSGLNFEHFIC